MINAVTVNEIRGERLVDESPVLADTTEAASKTFFPAIQGLRGVAAMSVLLVHLYDMPLLSGFLPPVWDWLQSIINMGGHGVELFFMISGFLIPASLVRHRSLSKFFYDRVLRIMPVFVILHLVLFTIGPVVGYKFFKDIGFVSYIEVFFANLVFLQDALNLPIGQQAAWTLSYEWAFYIWFAMIFVASKRRSWLATGLLVALALAGVIYRPSTAFFGIGMAFSAISFRLPLSGWVGFLASLLCITAMYVSIEYINPLVGLLPGFLLFAMVITPTSWFATILNTRALQFLGKISYSLYLVHPFALFPLQVLGVKLAAKGFNLWLLWALFAALGFVLALVASTLSYELIEVRLRHWLNRIFTPRGTGRPILAMSSLDRSE